MSKSKGPETVVPTALQIARQLVVSTNGKKDASDDFSGRLRIDIVDAAVREEARIPRGLRAVRLIGREARRAKERTEANLRALAFLATNGDTVVRHTQGQVQLRHGGGQISKAHYGYLSNEVSVRFGDGSQIRVTDGHWPQLDDQSGHRDLPAGVEGAAVDRMMVGLLRADYSARDDSVSRSWAASAA